MIDRSPKTKRRSCLKPPKKKKVTDFFEGIKSITEFVGVIIAVAVVVVMVCNTSQTKTALDKTDTALGLTEKSITIAHEQLKIVEKGQETAEENLNLYKNKIISDSIYQHKVDSLNAVINYQNKLANAPSFSVNFDSLRYWGNEEYRRNFGFDTSDTNLGAVYAYFTIENISNVPLNGVYFNLLQSRTKEEYEKNIFAFESHLKLNSEAEPINKIHTYSREIIRPNEIVTEHGPLSNRYFSNGSIYIGFSIIGSCGENIYTEVHPYFVWLVAGGGGTPSIIPDGIERELK